MDSEQEKCIYADENNHHAMMDLVWHHQGNGHNFFVCHKCGYAEIDLNSPFILAEIEKAVKEANVKLDSKVCQDCKSKHIAEIEKAKRKGIQIATDHIIDKMGLNNNITLTAEYLEIMPEIIKEQE